MMQQNKKEANNQYLFSVVIPVYNAQDTLPRCLDSVVSQNRGDIEIVIVDDGSTDASLSICSGYRDRFSNIKVIVSDHEGVGRARNKGIQACSGVWLLFLDSDDWYAENAFDILRRAVMNDADVIMFAVMKIRGGRVLPLDKSMSLSGDAHTMAKIILLPVSPYQGYMTNKCVKRSVVVRNGLLLSEEYTHCEDEEWWLRVALCIEKVVVLSDYLYYYRYEVTGLRGNNDAPAEATARGAIVRFVVAHWPDLEELAVIKHVIWQNACIYRVLKTRDSLCLSDVINGGYRRQYYLSSQVSLRAKISALVLGAYSRLYCIFKNIKHEI